MIEQSFSIYHLEYFLAILVRVMGVMAFAPIFGNNQTVTRRPRLFLGVAFSIALFYAHPYIPLGYTTFLGYTIIIVKELVVGITLGFMANVSLSIIGMAGQFIDREMGFSMVSNFDQTFNTDTTITAEFYSMLVMLVMLCSDMHYFILDALADSFDLIPLGNVLFDSGKMYDVMISYMTSYFTIALRISLPIFVVIMLLNTVLGILAKTAPQMNMFVIGVQLKIFCGFAVLMIIIQFVPSVTEFVYKQMQDIVYAMMETFYIK
ncbi:MAG: flagellar biosynthetic protein FliR [Eubacteriales bacterium]|nr:flagellar biosynthetic protein FliR [Eubacteriales bacterium]